MRVSSFLSFISSCTGFIGSCWEDWNKQDCAVNGHLYSEDTLRSLDCHTPDLLVFCFSFYLILPITLFVAPIPPSRRHGFQFRAEEIDDFLEIVETYLPISAQNWQAVADSHSENHPREQRTAELLRCKFQEISRRTGPTGDPTCPPYVIKAKQINRPDDWCIVWWIGGQKE